MAILQENDVFVKVHQRLASRILRERRDIPYRLWCALRAHDSAGRGLFFMADVFRLAVGHVMTREQIYGAIKDDLFFVRDGDVLKLRSLVSVAEALGVKPRQPALVPLAALSSAKRFRAHCVAASFAGEGQGDKLIALGTIASRYGRTRKTIRCWLRLAGVKIIEHVMESEQTPRQPDKEMVSRGWFLGRKVVTELKDGKEVRAWKQVLYRRMMNSYQSSLEMGRQGRSRRVRLDTDKPGFSLRRSRGIVKHIKVKHANKAYRDKVDALTEQPDGNTLYAHVGEKRSRYGKAWEAHVSLDGRARVL